MVRAYRREIHANGKVLKLSGWDGHRFCPGPFPLLAVLVMLLVMTAFALMPTATDIPGSNVPLAGNLPASLILFSVPSGSGSDSAAPVLPVLPQATVDLTMPTQNGTIRNVKAGDATGLQGAINAATCGDTIVLSAGSTYSGNFTIPATSCSGWIEIVTSSLTNLPPSGNRVGPGNTANMAKISTPNVSAAIQFLPGASHWRLIGLEISTSYVSTGNVVYNLVSAGLQADGSTSITVQSQLPAYLIFDRIYIHGLPTTNTKRAIQMDSQAVAVVDSYCDEIHYNANDSQCFASWNGTGPYLIQNNFIQAGAEDILFGGADPAIANLVPSDISIVGNTIQKNQSWRGEAAPYNWVIKNLVELKNAQRVLLDGNVIQYIWSAGQVGFAVLLTPRNQNGNCSWCSVNDVTVTHNLIQHAAQGIEIAGSDSNNPSLPSARVLVQNNVLDDINSANWSGHGWAFELMTSTTTTSPHDITIDHNTFFPDQTDLYLGDSSTIPNMKFTNNLGNYGLYGIFGNGVGSGALALSAFTPGYVYGDIVFITANGGSVGTYPPGTFWNTQAGAQFTNFASANYQLLSSSPYHNAGSDGKDIGVWDWTCLHNDSAAALAGKFVPSAGCSTSRNLLPQPPTFLNAVVQ